MPKATDDAIHLHMTVRQKDHVQGYVAFQTKATPFGSVFGPWLVQDRDCSVGRGVVASFFLRSFRGGRSITKSAGLNRCAAAFTAARGRVRCAISKTGAGHRSTNAFVASGAVAVTWPIGKSI